MAHRRQHLDACDTSRCARNAVNVSCGWSPSKRFQESDVIQSSFVIGTEGTSSSSNYRQ